MCINKNIYSLKYNWCFILIGLLAIFMHCFMLGSIPYGLHVDEIGMGYDAWSIANFGVERYLKSYPAYLVNFGGGQSVLYCYISVILIKLFGLSVYTMRIPAVIFSGLTLIFGTKIIMKKWKTDKKVWFTFIVLYTILPYFTMSSRFGLDCNLMLGMSTVFLYFLILAVDKQRYYYFALAGLLGGLVLYSYVLSYLVMPVFLVLSLAYLLYIKKIKVKQFLLMGIVFGMVSFPLIMIQMINMFNLPEMKIGSITLTKLFYYRSGELSIRSMIPNALEVVKSVFFYDVLEYNTFSEYYTLYWISIPFAILGIGKGINCLAKMLTKKSFDISVIILFWVAAEFLVGCMLVGDTANTNKINGIFFGILFFIVEGIWWVYSFGPSWRKKICYITMIIYMISFISFFHYYFFEYKTDRYPQSLFAHEYTEAYDYVKTGLDETLSEKTTYIVSDLNNYVYFLVSSKTSPYDYDLINNGTERYKNYIFSPPSEIDVNAVYIVAQSKTDYLAQLSTLEFTLEKKGTYYVCYQVIY